MDRVFDEHLIQNLVIAFLNALSLSLPSFTVVTVAAQSSADGKSAFVSRRARMLYGRFKRSKDLTLYNEDDLGCVLGKKEKRPAHLRAAEEEAAAAQPALGNGVHEVRLRVDCRRL